MKPETIKNINYMIQNLYKKIIQDELDIPAEDYLIKEFDENFVFEIFFKQYLLLNKFNEINPKRKLATELIDTIIYNKGHISLNELVEVINYKEKKTIDVGQIEHQKIFDIEVNNIPIEMDSDYNEKINNIILNNDIDEQEQIIIKEGESDGDGQQIKNKKKNRKFFKRNN